MGMIIGVSTAIPSATAPREPGSVMIKVRPDTPATALDTTERGVDSSPLRQNALTTPGSSRSRYGVTASTVRSSSDNPVPPVVMSTLRSGVMAVRSSSATSASATTRASGVEKPSLPQPLHENRSCLVFVDSLGCARRYNDNKGGFHSSSPNGIDLHCRTRVIVRASSDAD